MRFEDDTGHKVKNLAEGSQRPLYAITLMSYFWFTSASDSGFYSVFQASLPSTFTELLPSLDQESLKTPGPNGLIVAIPAIEHFDSVIPFAIT
jgi:hypothetical protein